MSDPTAPTRRPRPGHFASTAVFLLAAAACGDGPETIAQPEPDVAPEPSLSLVQAPVIDPQVGYFALYAGDAGEADEVENYTVAPLTDFSGSIDSDFARTWAEVVLTSEADGSQTISISDSMTVRPGGAHSALSSYIAFEVLEEVSYEITGGMDGSWDGSPTRSIQFANSIQFNQSFPWEVLYFEGDNTLDETPVSFSLNGVNEGTIGGGGASGGSTTGVLQPGWHNISWVSSTFSRGGGFRATAFAEYSIRLTPTTPRGPVTKDDCKNGGWALFGFRNQGQCVRFVETGKDSRGG